MNHPMRRGQLGKNPDGSYVLINDKKKAYKADMALVVVWDYCDGTRSEDEVIKMLAERMEVPRRKVAKTVPMIIAKLRTLELIQ